MGPELGFARPGKTYSGVNTIDYTHTGEALTYC